MSTLQYPRRAVRYGIEGHVEVAFDINEDGEVVDLRVVEAKPQLVFDKAATQYIKKIKFLPPRLDGKGVYVSDISMRMPFRLQWNLNALNTHQFTKRDESREADEH